MLQWFSAFFSVFARTVSGIRFIDILDIACLTVILYFMYKFIRDRRAGKLALGVILIMLFLFMSELFEMHAMQFILRNVFQVGIITLVILFQPELRSLLEKMGGESIKSLKSVGGDRDSMIVKRTISEVVSAACDMSESKTGALIVFERTTKLGDLILTGTIINAQASSFLIKNIFFNKAPLHDGALIIRAGRLHAAGCLLPLSVNPDIIKDLGTRHRAAIGASENSDAVVLVVSEETGTISLACEGKLTRHFDRVTLTEELNRYLVHESSADAIKFNPKNLIHDKKNTNKKNQS